MKSSPIVGIIMVLAILLPFSLDIVHGGNARSVLPNAVMQESSSGAFFVFA